MKIQQLQKDLIKDALIALVVVGVTGAIYMAVSSWETQQTATKTAAESRMNQQMGELNGLRTKLANAGKDQARFAELMQTRSEGNFRFDNPRTREVLENLVKKHRITVNGKLEYSGEEPVALPELTNTTLGFAVRRDATVKMEAILDLHIYALMDGLIRDLPGMINIKNLKLTRKAPLKDEAMASISLGNNVNMVDAEVIFDWYATVPKDLASQGLASEGGQ